MVRNLTAASPSFVVERLRPASILEAAVYASNREGRSGVARVKASTLKRPRPAKAEKKKRLRFSGDARGNDGRGEEGGERASERVRLRERWMDGFQRMHRNR